MNNLYNSQIYHVMISSTGAPSTTDKQADVVLDTAGYDSVMWIATLETSTASSTGYGKLYHMHSDSTSTTDMVSCTGASFIAETTSLEDRMLVLDVNKPLKRYVSAYFAQNAAVHPNVIGILYKNKSGPVTQSTGTYGVIDSALAISPTT